MTDDLDRWLAAANPVPMANIARGTLDARARADLLAILDSPHAARRTPSRRRVLVAGGLVAAAAGGFLVAGPSEFAGDQRAYAATPPILAFAPAPGDHDAARVLRQISARVAALPDDAGSGRYAMISTQGWYLWTRVDGQQVTSAVVPTTTTSWTTADGSALVQTTRQLPGEDQPRVERQTHPAGGRSFMWPLGSLSADDRKLSQQLAQGHPAANGPAERITALSDAYLEQVLRPPVRAAMLRYLARTPGLTLRGTGKDRLGRPGIAFSLDSAASGLPTQYTVIVDETTGLVLDVEEMLTTTAGKLNVPVPSVISYTAFIKSKQTAQPGED